MSIKNKTEIKTQYVTSDNTIFDNYEEAKNHEQFLTRERVLANSLSIFEYNLYLITTEDELEAIKNDSYGENQFHLPEELSYPFYLCETTYDDFYRCYWTLDAVIEHEETLLKALKDVNIQEI